MRIGVSLRSGYDLDDPRLGARWMIERTVAAREAGLDSLFVGDHHVTPIAYYQNSPVLGRLLAEWGDRPVGALFLLPLWHPVLVAEQIGTLASLTQGRFILQCALGGGPAQFAGMGADMRRRARDFETSLGVIRGLLEGRMVTAEEPYPIQDAAVGLRPPEPVEVWIGADAEKAIGRAARLGDAWYAGPGLTHEEAARKLVHYRQRCEAHGRVPTCFPIRRDVFLAGSAAEAADIRAAVTTEGHRGFNPTALAIGSPDEVAAHFRTLGETGYTDVIVRQLTDDQDQALASYRRLREVREALAD
jgi:alkanesulfonate monooxygenase SsuD/methylene tetrahydromethanopterin reductase-like flavin-dependent oxidoreductase (luciferase family)